MKLILVLWIVMGNNQADNVQGYEYKSEVSCTQALEIVERNNPNINGLCITETMWKELGNS
jgi:hypothetical protein